MRVYIGLSAQVSERAAVRAGLTHEESGTASTPDTAVAEVLPSPAVTVLSLPPDTDMSRVNQHCHGTMRQCVGGGGR